MSYAGGVLLLLFAVGLLIANGLTVVTGVLLVVGVVFLAVVLFDLPISAEFRRDGVVRRALLRNEFLSWDRVTRLRRLRTGVMPRRQRRGGGLVAKVGRRTYILVDTMEGTIEFDDLRRLLGDRGESLGLTADLRPTEGRSPTWLYRRDRWKPESARKVGS